MKRIITFLITTILLIIPFSNKLFAAEEEQPEIIGDASKWSLDEKGYYNYEWGNKAVSFEIKDIDFTKYNFEYFHTDSGWKELVPATNDTIKLSQSFGENYSRRTLFVNNETIVSGTAGPYGTSKYVNFRYKYIEDAITDPVDPIEPPKASYEWVLGDNDYYFYEYSFDLDTTVLPVNVENQNNQIVEFQIFNEYDELASSNWKVINLNDNARMYLRISAQPYSYVFTLVVVEGATERIVATAYYGRVGFDETLREKIRVRKKAITEVEPTPLELLPITRSSIYSLKMDMGSVKFVVDGFNLTAIINYDNQIYYLKYSFDTSTDMSIFNNNYEVFYYSHNDNNKVNKYILVNLGNESIFTSRDIKKQTFIPYVVWNLNTDEIEKLDRFNTYMYTKKEAGNNVYAYFYVDEFIIDELLSISLAYRYRYAKTFGGYTEWEEQSMLLEASNNVKVSPVTWQGKMLSTTAVAMSVGAFIPGARWPILAVGTAVLLYAGSQTDVSPVKFGNINQIEEVNTTNALTNELNSAFLKYDSNFDLDPDLKVFKLHLGQFDRAFSKGVDFDNDYSVIDGQTGINIIQLTYRTDTKLYTIKGSNINVVLEEGFGTGKLVKNNNSLVTIIIFASLVIIVILGITTNAFSNPKKALKFVLSVIIFIVFVVVLYIVFKNYNILI